MIRSCLIWRGVALLLCLVATIPAAFCGEGDLFYLCRQMSTPPDIDGAVQSDEWAGIDPAGSLVVTRTGADAPVKTLFRIGYDRENLYFAVVCEETEPDKIKATTRVHDDDVYSDDCIELCLDTVHEHATMTKFIVNSLGTICDFRHGNTDWDGDVEVATAVKDDSWTVEMRIPFAELGAFPKSGDVWGLNVFRTRYVEGTELFNWYNANGVFTLTTRLGHLVFDGPGVRIPNMAAAHSWQNFDLEPELARLGDSFEGQPWTALDNELAQDHSMRTSITLPHLRVCGPFEGGPVRALVFLRVRGTGRDAGVGTRARDIVELADRFDISPTAVFINDDGVCGGPLGERRLRALLQDQYDLYMFVGTPPSMLPAWPLAEIKAKIKRGAGVLCVYEGRGFLESNSEPTEVPGALADCLPVADLHGYESLADDGITGVTGGANPLLSCFNFGKGRAALVAYPGDPHSLTRFVALDNTSYTEYDYWLALAGLTAAWCAGRDPEIHFDLPDAFTQKRDILPSVCRIAVRGTRSEISGSVRVDVYVRDETGNRTKILSKHIKLTAAREAELDIPIPQLPYGKYFLELQAWRGDSVVGFGAGVFEVQGPKMLDSLVLADDYAERGGTISGTFSTAGLGEIDGAACAVELVTRDGRVLARKYIENLQELTHDFSFIVPEDTTILMTVRASVSDSRGVLDSISAPFFVPNRRRGTFNGVMWDAPDEPMGACAYESMRRAGFNISLNGTATPVTDWTDFSAIPYATRLTNSRDADGVTNSGCWEDANALQNRLEAAIEKQKNNWKRGVFAYSLGDENDTLGCCLHPACIAAYRAYLARQYGSIQALNESWGENYKSFDEVDTLDGDDFFTHSEAFRTGKFARWFDRYRFAQQSYAGICGKFADAFRNLDPQAITGFEGAGGFGDDVDAILDNVGMWATYNNVIDDIVRALDRPRILRGNWSGYTKDADSLAAFAWRSICLGADSLWWWRWDGIGQYRGFVSPTLDLWPATLALTDEMKPVFEGLGQLLINAKLENDGVAILYSVDSAVVDKLPSEQPFGRGATAHSAFIHMLKDSGIQYGYVTPRDCASGALARYRVLILPHCISLSPETAAEVRSFVERGGTLIADLRPGIMDNHVKSLASGPLDDVFGVKRAGPGRAVRFKGWVTATVCGRQLNISSLRAVVDADYFTAGSTAGATVSEMPIFIENNYGKGRTLLLNFSLDYFESIREQIASAEIREPIIATCEQAGVLIPIRISAASGEPLSMTELTRWSLDDGQIISLRTDRYGWGWADVGPGPVEKERTVLVTLPEPRVVYDLRNRKNLGRVSEFRATLRTGYANFYGIFDQPLENPTLTCEISNTEDGKRLTASITTSTPQTAVLFNLIDSTGNRPEWARKVINVKEGRGNVSWQLPLNGPDRWRVEARELFTGIDVRAEAGR